ncbi:MAG: response regulator [Burkholderiales bacterium]
MFKTLIVEDNSAFRQSLSAMLNSRFPDMLLVEVDSGEEALKQMNKLHPDLVFMDVKLPNANGLDLTKIIKDEHVNTIVVVMTGSDLPEYRQAAFLCGASYFVSKSATTEEQIFSVVDSVRHQVEYQSAVSQPI